MSKEDREELLLNKFVDYCKGLTAGKPAYELRQELLSENELSKEEQTHLNSLFQLELEFRCNQYF